MKAAVCVFDSNNAGSQHRTMRATRPHHRPFLGGLSSLLAATVVAGAACSSSVSPAATTSATSAPPNATAVTATDAGPPGSAPPGTAPPGSAPATVASSPRFAAALDALERQYGATIGVYALDTGDGATLEHRADERFAFCSTFKALEAGVLLRRDTAAQLAETVTYGPSEIIANSPISSTHQVTGMTVDALIAAAVQVSDSTAANVLLRRIGGPAALERELRDVGDQTTDVDRYEPDLSAATPGDPRDTTTPRALADDLQTFVLGDVLAPARRDELRQLLVGDKTGGPFIRAGVPAGWEVGDKTGHGDYGTRNDIAVLWPPGRRPIVVAILSHRSDQNADSADALLADTTRAIISELT
jgi:beta-lactamase class A